MAIVNKTPEQIAARRVRVAEMYANGEVMTTSKRAAAIRNQKKQQQLQDAADRILNSLQSTTRRSTRPMGSSPTMSKESAPDATSYLSSRTKVDTRAVAADKVLQELLNI